MIPAFPPRISSIWARTICGWAMSQCLPTPGFRFLQQYEISALKLQELSDDTEDGYIFEVDLHYPTHLHDPHDDYPLSPPPPPPPSHQ